MSGRRVVARVAALCALACSGLLLAGSPASALIEQGHVPGIPFAKGGSGTGAISKAQGIAVGEAAERVYIADTGNSRVDVFTVTGEFVEAWGWGVLDEKEEFETCKASEKCHAGIAGSGEGQFSEPQAIAVDNSTGASAGDVYVLAEPESESVEKFDAEGKFLGRVTVANTAALQGMAVDSAGSLFLYEGEFGFIEGFTGGEPNVPQSLIALGFECGKPGFAVNGAGNLFYADHQIEALELGCPEKVDAKDPVLTAQLKLQGETAAQEIEALDSKSSTGVAVDEGSTSTAGAVYVDNVTSVAAFTPSGALIQEFGELKKGTGVAVDAATDTVYVADASTNTVSMFLPESAGPPQINEVSAQNVTPTETKLIAQIDAHGIQTEYSFEYGTVNCEENPGDCTKVEGAGPLAAEFGDKEVSITVANLAPSTTYHYRVVAKSTGGEVALESTVGTFTTLPNPAGLLADGRRWELVSPAEKQGASVVPLDYGIESFTGGLDQANPEGTVLAYATDAPVDTEPVGNRAPEGIQVMATRRPSGWNTEELVTPHERAEGIEVGFPQEYRFFSKDLSIALLQPFGILGNPLQLPPLVPGQESEERGIYMRHNQTCPADCYEPIVGPEDDITAAAFGGLLEFITATSDLKHVMFSSEQRLTTTAPKEGGGLYEWSAGEPSSLTYVSVLPPGDGGSEKGAPAAQLAGDQQGVNENDRNAISEDGSRVFFDTENEAEEHISFLYMRDVQSGKTIQLNAQEEGSIRGSGEGREIEETDHTMKFQAATADGSRVFFTDSTNLTPESKIPLAKTSPAPADLYVCDISEGAEGPECALKDITIDEDFGEPADVVGAIQGISSDGNTVYFVANGRLAQGAVKGKCVDSFREEEIPGAQCNLYVEHFNGTGWERPKLIAVLSQEDNPDWANSGGEKLLHLTARTTGGGTYLAFMSQESLTGYDNVDANSGARDEEVFLYDSQAGTLTCVSCNPSGAQPTGVFDQEAAGEGGGLIVDPLSDIWRSRWLAGSIPGWTAIAQEANPYQSRYLLEDGRLFFNSADSLVPQATKHRTEIVEGHEYHVGVENVYEFEPQGVGSCQQAGGCVSLISAGGSEQESGSGSEHESAFVDASEDGSSVFFVTSRQLWPNDRDTNEDMYDARVCTASSPCLEPPPSPPPACSTLQSCHETEGPPAPVYAPPLSSTFTGPGNGVLNITETQKPKPKPPTKKELLAKALAKCRKHYKHSKHKRASCERKARHKYGHKKKAKKKKK